MNGSPVRLSFRLSVGPAGRTPLFLDERSKVFYPDWETSAREAVSAMRLLAGRDPNDRALMALVGELATRSTHSTGTKKIHHPVVGDLTIGYEVLSLASTPGLALVTYLAEPATSSADALNLLRTWTAGEAHTENADRTNR